jgi:hypothetical protein
MQFCKLGSKVKPSVEAHALSVLPGSSLFKSLNPSKSLSKNDPQLSNVVALTISL